MHWLKIQPVYFSEFSHKKQNNVEYALRKGRVKYFEKIIDCMAQLYSSQIVQRYLLFSQ